MDHDYRNDRRAPYERRARTTSAGSAPDAAGRTSRTAPAGTRASAAPRTGGTYARPASTGARTAPAASRAASAGARTSQTVTRTSPAVTRTGSTVTRTGSTVTRTGSAARTGPSASRPASTASRPAAAASRPASAARRTVPSRTAPASAKAGTSVRRFTAPARRRGAQVDKRLLVMIALGALSIVLLVVGITGMTRGRSKSPQADTTRRINWNATAAPAAAPAEDNYFVDTGAPETDGPDDGEYGEWDAEPESGETPSGDASNEQSFGDAAAGQSFGTATASADSIRDDEYGGNAIYRPDAKEGFLPVFAKADTPEKIIAITIDDCFQGGNMLKIVDSAIAAGAKVTFFPIGKNMTEKKTTQREAIRKAWENGFEIEDHTMTHNNLIRSTREELAWEVYNQQLLLSDILGVEYHVHFLRGRGGDSRNDQRIHAYCAQIGYYGIAHWAKSGSANSIENLKETIKPGLIYLFHTTDSDTKKLLEFIPWAVSQGYRLVTMNEMFGYPDNECYELTQPIESYQTPPLQDYVVQPVTYKNTTYAYGAYVIQQQLIALGYLSGEPDGVYGKGTAKAVSAFQKDHALSVTGEADPATQTALTQACRNAGYANPDGAYEAG